MNITRPKWYKGKLKIIVRNNGKICPDDDTEERLQKLVDPPHSIQFSDNCGKKCLGGVVDDGKAEKKFLSSLTDCNIMLGSLIIRNNDFESSFNLLDKFKKIMHIEGSLIVTNNTGIKNLSFLESLRNISDTTTIRPIIQIVGNPNLTSINPLHKVGLEYEEDEVDVVAVIETYSEISHDEKKKLKERAGGKVVFRVLDKKRRPSVADAKTKKGHGAGGRRTHKPQDEDRDNLGTGEYSNV
ncbi:hypothetical protein COOONC_27717 [Cooperia oncophora]